LSQLTEQEIIRAALPFIRSHYKFRPRGEAIMYTIQNKLLNWDSLACTALLLAAGYTYFHYHGHNIAQTLGEIPTVLILSGGLCLGLFLFRLLLGWMRRYR